MVYILKIWIVFLKYKYEQNSKTKKLKRNIWYNIKFQDEDRRFVFVREIRNIKY